MTVEELQKACAALSEAWVKAMEPLKKLAEALNSVSGQIEQSEEKRKIHIVWKCKSHRRLPAYCEAKRPSLRNKTAAFRF